MKTLKYLAVVFLLIGFIACEKDSKTDIRDEIVGSYLCQVKHYSWMLGDTIDNTTITTDTLLVQKTGNLEIKILDYSFQLNEDLQYKEYFDGGKSIYVEFYPEIDSIHFKEEYRNLGGGSSKTFDGKKIID